MSCHTSRTVFRSRSLAPVRRNQAAPPPPAPFRVTTPFRRCECFETVHYAADALARKQLADRV